MFKQPIMMVAIAALTLNELAKTRRVNRQWTGGYLAAYKSPAWRDKKLLLASIVLRIPYEAKIWLCFKLKKLYSYKLTKVETAAKKHDVNADVF